MSHPLFKHQKQSIKFLRDKFAVFDMSDPGTGKTRVHIEEFAARRRKGGGPALVLCPKTIMQCAWGNDIARFAPDMKVSIAQATNRDKAFAAAADIYITNHDAAVVLAKKPAAFWKKFSSGTFIVDESSAYTALVNVARPQHQSLSNLNIAVYSPARPTATAFVIYGTKYLSSTEAAGSALHSSRFVRLPAHQNK